MRHLSKMLQLLIFTSVFFVSCQKDDTHKKEPRSLFSVDLDSEKFDITNNIEGYIAAYTPDGELINYGNLSDSVKWELKADYKQDFIDIVYFEISHKTSLHMDHFKNVPIGQSFTDPNKIASGAFINQAIKITFKVEDFGNRDGNSTSSTPYESRPYKHNRGNSYAYGEFLWDNMKDGYTYKSAYIDASLDSQGTEMTIFERGTNQPYISYINIPTADMNAGDTITLHKSDFKLGELKTIQVNSSDNDFDNLFLYTYNSKEGSRDLIASFDNVVPNSSNEKRIQYINSDVIPISYWKFSYSTRSANATSYAIRSNSKMPSNITVEELTGYAITKSGNKFNFTHGNIFPDKKIARSAVQFSKNADCSKFSYTQHFDGSESIGTTIIKPFNIPEEIINKYIGFKELNSLEWAGYSYSQTYTNIPENSSLDELKNTKLNYWNNDASEGKYSFETFSISLWGK